MSSCEVYEIFMSPYFLERLQTATSVCLISQTSGYDIFIKNVFSVSIIQRNIITFKKSRLKFQSCQELSYRHYNQKQSNVPCKIDLSKHFEKFWRICDFTRIFLQHRCFPRKFSKFFHKKCFRRTKWLSRLYVFLFNFELICLSANLFIF